MTIATQLRGRRGFGLSLATLAILLIFLFIYSSVPREPERLGSLQTPEAEETSPLQLSQHLPESEEVVHLKRINGNPLNATVHKGIVMAKTTAEDVRWLAEFSPDWMPYIYTTSTPPEPGFLIPPATRGHESITYLSYIITHYDNLPAYTLFIHASPEQWHNDLLGPFTSQLLTHLRLPSVDTLGYVNLRCAHHPGCPIDVNPLEPTETDIRNKDTRAYFSQIYEELLGYDAVVPQHIGNVCCGQFAVSRARIRERPREAYERMVRWAVETELTDDFGVGWVFEKMWHIIFGMNPVHCPPVEQCRCDLLGWCGPLPQNYSKADDA